MKKSARNKALKITVIYLIFGSLWILFSDKILQINVSDPRKAIFYSIVKGLFYVFATSVLFYTMIYPTLKEAFLGREALKEANENLTKSNEMYIKLYQDYREKQALLKSLIDSVPDLIFYKDTNGVYLGCNAAFEKFAGKTEKEIVGLTDKEIFPNAEAESFINSDKEMFDIKAFRREEEKVTFPNGTEVFYETLKTPYYDFDGNLIGVIGISRDITERKNREEKIKYISYHDKITGIHNRTFFDEIRHVIDRPENLPLSVIIGDINGMKLINDTFGHRKGDKVLYEVAQILKECIRDCDVVARTGGDEFTILMPHADAFLVKEVADKIKSMCTIKRKEENSEVYIDVALGYATKTDPAESLEKVMMYAEDWMYRRKLLEHRSIHNDYLSYIKTTMFEKSNETEEHAERLVKLSKMLGKELGLPDSKLDEIELVAVLHDLGKISIDKNILKKPGKLTDEEWREIKKHPEVGYRIAKSTAGLCHIAEYILCHHERWDGKGYPLGIAGEEIPIISRIITVVDSYDAMTQDRAYRKALPHEVAIQELINNKGTQFDPDIVDVFINKVLGEAPLEYAL